MTLFLLSPHRHPADRRVLRQVLRDPRRGQAGRTAGSTVLAVLAVLNAAVAAFYYLRVVVYMFMREPAAELPSSSTAGSCGPGSPSRPCSPSRSACSRTCCSGSSRTPPSAVTRLARIAPRR